MSAETHHCNLIAAHSVCTLDTITNMVLLNGEPVYALHANFFLAFTEKWQAYLESGVI